MTKKSKKAEVAPEFVLIPFVTGNLDTSGTININTQTEALVEHVNKDPEYFVAKD